MNGEVFAQQERNGPCEQALHLLGVPKTSIGYWYLLSALKVLQRDPQAATSLMKRIYFTVADIYVTSPQAVESGLRRTIGLCWEHSSHALLGEIMGEELPARPTVGRFLVAISTWCEIRNP